MKEWTSPPKIFLALRTWSISPDRLQLPRDRNNWLWLAGFEIQGISIDRIQLFVASNCWLIISMSCGGSHQNQSKKVFFQSILCLSLISVNYRLIYDTGKNQLFFVTNAGDTGTDTQTHTRTHTHTHTHTLTHTHTRKQQEMWTIK